MTYSYSITRKLLLFHSKISTPCGNKLIILNKTIVIHENLQAFTGCQFMLFMLCIYTFLFSEYTYFFKLGYSFRKLFSVSTAASESRYLLQTKVFRSTKLSKRSKEKSIHTFINVNTNKLDLLNNFQEALNKS